MSFPEEDDVRCGECGKVSRVRIWASVTGSQDRHLRDELLAGNLNIVCSHCRAQAQLNDLLYHDAERRFMVASGPLQRVAEEIARLSSPEYCLRRVEALRDLVEKIRVFEADLDDRVIEIVKRTLLIRLATDRTGETHRLFFAGRGDECDEEGSAAELGFLHLSPTGDEQFLYIPRDRTYEGILGAVTRAGALPPNSDGWQRIDARWAEEFMARLGWGTRFSAP